MNAKCPICSEKLIGFRLIQKNNYEFKEKCNIIIENENCLRIFKPENALDFPGVFNVYCENPTCQYGLQDSEKDSRKIGVLSNSGDMCYTMGMIQDSVDK